MHKSRDVGAADASRIRCRHQEEGDDKGVSQAEIRGVASGDPVASPRPSACGTLQLAGRVVRSSGHRAETGSCPNRGNMAPTWFRPGGSVAKSIGSKVVAHETIDDAEATQDAKQTIIRLHMAPLHYAADVCEKVKEELPNVHPSMFQAAANLGAYQPSTQHARTFARYADTGWAHLTVTIDEWEEVLKWARHFASANLWADAAVVTDFEEPSKRPTTLATSLTTCAVLRSRTRSWRTMCQSSQLPIMSCDDALQPF